MFMFPGGFYGWYFVLPRPFQTNDSGYSGNMSEKCFLRRLLVMFVEQNGVYTLTFRSGEKEFSRNDFG